MNKIYAFDQGLYNPHKSINVEIKLNKAKKDERIFFKEGELPYEVRYDNSYPNVFYDEKAKKYRCYYSTFTKDEHSESVAIEDRKNVDYDPRKKRVVSLCYAESLDGINWTKPLIKDGTNIIGEYLHGTCVFYDKQDEEYKMMTKIDYRSGYQYMAVANSKDGINFSEPQRTKDFNPRGDTHNYVLYDEYLRKYVLITRNWRNSFRIPCVSFSDNFFNFTPPQEILDNGDFFYQVYSMPIFKLGQYTMGLASIYHEGDRMDKDFDTVDLGLAYSINMIDWDFIDKHNYLIEREEVNYGVSSEDSGCIFASAPIKKDNLLYIYYMGGNGRHTNFRETCLKRAVIHEDKLAYMKSKRSDVESEIYTNPFIFLDKKVIIDSEIYEDGYIEIELYDKDYNKIKDKIISFDGRNLILDESLDLEQCRMRVVFKNAIIYGIHGNIELNKLNDDNVMYRR